MSITQLQFNGDAVNITSGSSIPWPRNKRILRAGPGVTSLADIVLPVISTIPTGYPRFVLVNEAGVSVELRENDLTLVLTVTDDQIIEVYVAEVSGVKTWLTRVHVLNSEGSIV